MSKFCTQCGNLMNDNDMFCAKCGTKQKALPAAPTPTYPQSYQSKPLQPAVNSNYIPGPAPVYAGPPIPPSPYSYQISSKKSKKGLVIGVSIGAVVVIAAVVIMIVVLTGGKIKQNTPEELFGTLRDAAIDSINSGKQLDSEYYDLIFEYHFANADKKAEVSLELSRYLPYYTTDPSVKERYGENVRCTYLITSYETVSPDDYSGYIGTSFIDLDLSRIQEMRINFTDITITGSKSSYTDTRGMITIKVDGKWYIGGSSI